MKKYIVPALFSIAFVFLLMSLSSTIRIQNQPKPLPTQSPTPTEIPWQTYRNDKYGFEFQYPSELEPKETNNSLEFWYKGSAPLPSVITIEETNKSYELIIKEYESIRYPKPTCSSTKCIVYSKLIYEKEVVENNINFKTFSVTGDESEIYFIYVSNNNKKYLISFFGDNYLNKFISNFKFLPDTSTWKTYRNEKYGFEFKYPNDWVVDEETLSKIISEDDYVFYLKPKKLSTSREVILTIQILRGVQANYLFKDTRLLQTQTYGNNKFFVGGFITLDGMIESLFITGNEKLVARLNFGIGNRSDSLPLPKVENYQKELKDVESILSTIKFTQPYFCGGIAGVACPTGYKCILDGQYPDAGGKCSKIEPSTTKYVCPADEWVSCMPPLGINKSQCQPEYLKWAKDYCPNFKGAAL